MAYEHEDERTDECDHLNVREMAGGILECEDCGETRLPIVLPRDIWDEEE